MGKRLPYTTRFRAKYSNFRGLENKNDNNVLVNHLTLLFQYFIYRNKTVKHAINIHALKNYVKLVITCKKLHVTKIDLKNTLQSGRQLPNSSAPYEQTVGD